MKRHPDRPRRQVPDFALPNPGYLLDAQGSAQFAHFCSKITQDVRDYATTLGDNERAALFPHPEEGAKSFSEFGRLKVKAERGMQERSKKFLDLGAKMYVDRTR